MEWMVSVPNIADFNEIQTFDRSDDEDLYISLVWKLQQKSYRLGQKICVNWIQMKAKKNKTKSPDFF